jgi:aryl-alcohol dehydrogenase-like predicted oxidoreductase
MEYRTLGSTGMTVSTQCLGAMMFGPWGNDDVDSCVKMINHALDEGINFIDTADVYSQGVSEEIVGQAIEGRRDEVVLATKVHGQMGEGRNRSGNSRRWIMREVEDSLRRLRTDHIDLYQIHRPDPTVPIEETLGACSDLVRAGKVRHIGSSTFPAEQIVDAQWVATDRNLERFVCEQPPYSILFRHIERDVLPTVERFDMGTIVWSPLAGGLLTGKYRVDRDAPEGSRYERAAEQMPALADRMDLTNEGNQRKLEAVEALLDVAETAGIPLTHLALAWVLEHPAVTSAIIGPRTPEQLDDLLAGADVTLDEDILDAIDRIVPPGTVLFDEDRGWKPPALDDPGLRRRES